MTKRILFLAVNPKDTPRLRLDQEIRSVDEGLQRVRHQGMFILHHKWAVRSKDVRRAMLDYRPQIVHFSGQGFGGADTILENDAGTIKCRYFGSTGRAF